MLMIVGAMAAACSSGNATASQSTVASATDSAAAVQRPAFNADSAYSYVAAQTAFGPRVPGTAAHEACERFIIDRLKLANADTVWTQKAQVKAFDGKSLPMVNILAGFNSNAKKRILLLAHYDTRPWADNESDETRKNTPIDGANDGASGVGVMLEIARAISAQQPGVGIDMLFTDVEDYGTNSDGGDEDSWCLGTQYWARNNPYAAGGRPAYGILLDMVGGRGARFHREYTSSQLAPAVVNKGWGIAAASPYASFFPNEFGAGVTDDHLYVNSAGIPCIDIIECANPQTGGFPSTWHTLDDTIENIDPATLKAVGEVLLDVIFTEPNE